MFPSFLYSSIRVFVVKHNPTRANPKVNGFIKHLHNFEESSSKKKNKSRSFWTEFAFALSRHQAISYNHITVRTLGKLTLYVLAEYMQKWQLACSSEILIF